MNEAGRPLHATLLLTFLLSALSVGTLHADQGLEDLLDTRINTASKYSQYVRTAPASVTVVTSEEIDRFGYRSLLEVLNHVPGFYTSDDRNYSYVGVRGLGRPGDFNSRILLLLNGQPLNEIFYGGTDFGYEPGLPLSILDRIEIVRGPGSALYGSGAMFAVVNLIVREPASEPTISAFLEAGNLDTRLAAADADYTNDDFSVLLAGQIRSTDGEDLYFEEFDSPETNDGLASGIDSEEFRSALTMVRWGNFELQAYVNQRDKDVPTASYGTIFNDPRFQTSDNRTHASLSYLWDFDATSSLRVTGNMDLYDYDGSYPYEYLEPALWTETQDVHWWRITSEYSKLTERNSLVAGVEYLRSPRADYKAYEAGESYVDFDIPFNSYSLFVHDTYQLTPSLSLTAGLRYDDYSDIGSSLTPRAAIVYSPSSHYSFKLLFGEAFRRPNHFEAYYDDIDFQKANPDLKPEEVSTFEIVAEGQLSESVSGWVSVFRWDIDNLISQVVDPTDGLLQFRNIDTVRSYGGEAGFKVVLPGGTWGSASLTLQEGTDKTTGERLSNSPKRTARFGVVVPVLDRFSIGAQYRYEGSRLALDGTAVDSYQVTDLHLTTQELLEHWRFSVHVQNAFDEEYSVPGGLEHLQKSIPQFGRTYRVGVAFGF